MSQNSLPLVLAGPILRRLEPQFFCLCLATTQPVQLELVLAHSQADECIIPIEIPGPGGGRELRAGGRLFYYLVQLQLEEPLPADCLIEYDLKIRPKLAEESPWQAIQEWAPELCYPRRKRPCFQVPTRVDTLFHGSCRNSHFHKPGEGLTQLDEYLMPLARTAEAYDAEQWPSFLLLTGDQIYADDVAGPMLRATHELVEQLQLPREFLPIPTNVVADDRALFNHPDGYFARQKFLPSQNKSRPVIDMLFTGVRKPIFTSNHACNHLISLGEVLAMYLLSWSPVPWKLVNMQAPPHLRAQHHERYQQEQVYLQDFQKNLPAVRRVFAHLAVGMIFDDHDVSDDWNLSLEWEEVAYGHRFSRRVIGNALIGYLINQGWGNRPAAFSNKLMDLVQQTLDNPGKKTHEKCIKALLAFEKWDYKWPTTPPLVVLDTRTRRWPSDLSAGQPLGLMNWESITDLQQSLKGLPAVLMVSPAPIFGVKLIETIQRVVSWLGKPLLVDAENWMAHPGASTAILSVFRHPKTPKNFVILSGDVHYSFVYDVELRGEKGAPHIWQICSSGIRNEFPESLLDKLDRCNRWLYAPNSPLNWFTRRRTMKIIPRKPEGISSGRRLLNGSGIGLVQLDQEGRPHCIKPLLAKGESIEYTRRERETRWD